jgi:hypothetical protein
MNAQVKFEFGHVSMIFDRVMPLDEIFSLRSLTPQHWYNSTQIWHMDTSKECAGQVQIWSWFDDFLHSYAS